MTSRPSVATCLGAAILLAVSMMAACAQTKGQTKASAEDPGDKAFRPSSAIADAGSKPLDKASMDFQAEADAIAQDMKAGADWGDVAGRMEDLTRKHPGYGLAWYNLGVAYENMGKLDAASDAYKRAAKCAPPVREAQENLAALKARKGEGEEALELLKELVARDPGTSVARSALAGSYLSQGDLGRAEQLAKDALGRDPRNLSAYCVLANASIKKKDFRRAKLLAAQGFKIDQDAACLHHVLGLVALEEKETAVALVSFERAASKDPRLLDARFQIAQISMGYKDFRKAIANYAAVTEVDPKSAAAFVNLGVAYKGSGQLEQAEKAYLRAIEVAGQGGIAEAHFNLGVLYFKNLNRHEDAKTHFKRYLQLTDAQSDDAAFQMIEEIDKLKAMAEEEKRLAEEEAKQAEIEKKVAEDQAKRKAEQEKEVAEEKRREEEIQRKARDSGEPIDPLKGQGQETPPVPSPAKPDKKKDKKKPEGKGEPADPGAKPDDFE